jgi:hypothetical protein
MDEDEIDGNLITYVTISTRAFSAKRSDFRHASGVSE